MEGGFHGRTFAALTATAQPKYHEGFEPMLPGFVYVPYDDLSGGCHGRRRRDRGRPGRARARRRWDQHPFARVISPASARSATRTEHS